MRTIDSVGFLEKLGHINERNSNVSCAEDVDERVLEATVEKYDLLVLCNSYKLCKANLDCRQWERDFILEAMTALMKQLEVQLISLANEK